MRNFFRKTVYAGLLLLAGCAAPVEPRVSFPALDFQGQPPFVLDIAEIQVVPPAGTAAGPDFPVMPRDLALAWAASRLKTAGDSGLLTFHIREAAAAAEALPLEDGFSGFLKQEQQERLTARIRVTITATRPGGGEARTSAEAAITRDVPEGTDPRGREAIWFAMMQTLAAELDSRLGAGMQTYFGAYLKNS